MNTSTFLCTRFFIKKYKAKNNLAPVYVRILLDGKPLDISLKKEVDIDSWNTKTGRLKGNRPEIKSLNSYLDQIQAEISNCYADLRFKKQPLTVEAIKNLFCGITPEEQTLISLVNYHNSFLKDTLTWGTFKNYLTTQKYIQKFLKTHVKATDIPLSKLSYSFLVDFEIFLRKHRPHDHHKPCGHNTVLKHIERLKKMINVAVRNEWIERDPFAKFRARFIRNDRVSLSSEELSKIETANLKSPRLTWVQDLFVFSCYTGLSYSDVMTLTKDNIVPGIDGEYWISTSRKKTNQSVRIPILPKANSILQKYFHHPKAVAQGTLFPNLSNQKLNAYLKEIAEPCGIKKNLTFHIARHTFATTITLTNGVPIETVSKILGHTSIRTTQIYAKVIEQKVSEDMSKLKIKLMSSSLQRINSKSSSHPID